MWRGPTRRGVIARRAARRRRRAVRLCDAARSPRSSARVSQRLEGARPRAPGGALPRCRRVRGARLDSRRDACGDRPRWPARVEPREPARGVARPRAPGRDLSRRRLPPRQEGAGAPRVGGDGRSAAIAAASIVAKVVRDRVMRRLDALFPQYGFSSHVGYITPGHSARRPRARAARDPPAVPCGSLLPGIGRGVAPALPGGGREWRAVVHYCLRGYRVVGRNVLGRSLRDRPHRAARPAARVLRGEVEGRRPPRRPARDGRAGEGEAHLR